MRRSALLVVAALLLAGCIGNVPQTSPGGPSPSTPQAASPTGTPDQASPAGTPVEYAVRAGDVPDEFASVTVAIRAVFVDDPDDLGPCYPDLFRGPYKPTPTPLPTPTGDCHRSNPVTIDLTEIDGDRSVGPVTAPASARGHALVVTDVTATYGNGTSTTAIKGTGGVELIASPDPPERTDTVELGIGGARDTADYDYWLLTEEVEPSD